MSRGQIVSVRVFRPRIPFRLRFSHTRADRRESSPQVLEIALDDGTKGFGEAQPRAYVTGETEASVLEALQDDLAPWLVGQEVPDLGVAAALLGGDRARRLREAMPAAFCAVDLALLDAAGQRSGRSAAEVLGGVRRLDHPSDGAVVGIMAPAALRLFAAHLATRRLRWVKAKVGDAGDALRVGALRRTLGPEVELVLDANGAWTRGEAVARIRELSRFGVAAVEQPVPREDLEGLGEVGSRTGVPVVADESLCTRGDAMRLIRRGGPVQWNVRVGKCGGLIGGIELLRLAEAHGVVCHLGVMVGETALLRAAGRLLAACTPALDRVESDEGALLARDLARSTGSSPSAPVEVSPGPGLGVEVDPEALGPPWRTFDRPAHQPRDVLATA
jgi:L-alanine-DL-glutamate epimerase-like enolase superfamily enzyme